MGTSVIDCELCGDVCVCGTATIPTEPPPSESEEQYKSFDAWRDVCAELARQHSDRQSQVGELLIAGEKFGEKRVYDAAEELFRGTYTRKTLYKIKSIVAATCFLPRSKNLVFGHYEALAPLPSDQQQAWFDTAERENLSARELGRRIKQSLPRGKEPEPAQDEHERERDNQLELLAERKGISVAELKTHIIDEYLKMHADEVEQARADHEYEARIRRQVSRRAFDEKFGDALYLVLSTLDTCTDDFRSFKARWRSMTGHPFTEHDFYRARNVSGEFRDAFHDGSFKREDIQGICDRKN